MMSSSSSVQSKDETPAVTSKPANSSLGTTSEQTVSKLKGDEHCGVSGLMLEDFPVDSSNPFATAFCDSDLVLIVEGKKLHVHRPILSVYSAFFRVMLNSHFPEADAEEIELKSSEDVEIKYKAMVTFLLQLYPVHSFEGITDDSLLMDLFPLAEYFQCLHVRTKCEAYIRQRLELIGPLRSMDSTKVSATSALLYLRLCEKYDAEQFIDTLLELLSRKRLQNIVNHEHFQCLPPETQRDVLHRRALFVEQRLDHQVQTTADYFKDRLYTSSDVGCSKCSRMYRVASVICDDCAASFIHQLKGC